MPGTGEFWILRTKIYQFDVRRTSWSAREMQFLCDWHKRIMFRTSQYFLDTVLRTSASRFFEHTESALVCFQQINTVLVKKALSQASYLCNFLYLGGAIIKLKHWTPLQLRMPICLNELLTYDVAVKRFQHRQNLTLPQDCSLMSNLSGISTPLGNMQLHWGGGRALQWLQD